MFITVINWYLPLEENLMYGLNGTGLGLTRAANLPFQLYCFKQQVRHCFGSGTSQTACQETAPLKSMMCQHCFYIQYSGIQGCC